METNIKVIVRVRPVLETDKGSKCSRLNINSKAGEIM